MTITTTQKVIKIGTSKGVTLPAKELERLGVDAGDEIRVTFERAEPINEERVKFVELTQKLIKRHEKALKNLADR